MLLTYQCRTFLVLDNSDFVIVVVGELYRCRLWVIKSAKFALSHKYIYSIPFSVRFDSKYNQSLWIYRSLLSFVLHIHNAWKTNKWNSYFMWQTFIHQKYFFLFIFDDMVTSTKPLKFKTVSVSEIQRFTTKMSSKMSPRMIKVMVR